MRIENSKLEVEYRLDGAQRTCTAAELRAVCLRPGTVSECTAAQASAESQRRRGKLPLVMGALPTIFEGVTAPSKANPAVRRPTAQAKSAPLMPAEAKKSISPPPAAFSNLCSS
jgi:hypothetical protein